MNIPHAEQTSETDSHEPLEQEGTADERVREDRQVAAARAAHVLTRQRRLRTLRAALLANQ